jgi:hypothetical protein
MGVFEFLIFLVFSVFSPYLRSYILWKSFSIYFSFLDIFHVCECFS